MQIFSKLLVVSESSIKIKVTLHRALIVILLTFFFSWDSLYARPNSHYEAWSCKKKKHKKLKYAGNPFRKNLQLKHIC